MAADENDRVVCIINPASGVQRRRTIVQRIAAELPEAECWSTRYPGHGIALGRQAVEDGYGTVVAVGGDGTLSEVANGLLEGAGRRYGWRTCRPVPATTSLAACGRSPTSVACSTVPATGRPTSVR